MAAISDNDVSISVAGAIRWTGAATTNRHTVLEFIQFMMDKQDDGVAAGDIVLDITVDTPFDRSTDQIVALNTPFNIDDTFALHLYDGSVSQIDQDNGEETLYAGLRLIGPVEAGTEYMILQDGRILPAFWSTGINAEAAPSLVFSRHLVKVKKAGAQIDGQRIVVLARELGDQYRRFPATLGTGNSVAAIGNGADIFNTTAEATIAGWTITNVEGFQELNIDQTGAGGQEFYSQWAIGAQTVNDVYEFTKHIAQRSIEADVTGGTTTGADFVIENAAIVGQAQSFVPKAESQYITEVRARIKVLAGVPLGTVYCELWDSDDAGTPVPTGGALARSERILVSHFTSTYEETIFRFNRQDPDGTIAAQADQLVLDNPEYFIVFRNDEAPDASNTVSLEGASTDQDGTQSQADDTAAVWTGSLTDDIFCQVKSSPHLHGIAGERMEGISIEVAYDGATGGEVAEDDIAMWGTLITYDTLVAGPFVPGELVTFDTGTTLKAGATVLYDDGTAELLVALDTLSSLTTGDVITSVRGNGATETTAAINVTIVDQDKSGGTGLVLAKDDNTPTGELYIQVISGLDPVNNSRIRTDDITGDPELAYVDATVLDPFTLSPEFLGTSTGSNIIGSRGVGFNPNDVGSSDRFTDLNDGTRTPPNNVTFTVSGVVSGEDRVLAGPRTGTSLDTGMWQVNTALTVLAETALIVKTGTQTAGPFPPGEENWPLTGTGSGDPARLRIQRDDGIYQLIPYDSHDSSNTFTLGTPDTGAARTIDANVAGTFTWTAGGTVDFLAEGFEQGSRFTASGYVAGGLNTDFTVDTVTATVITVVDNTGMVTEAGDADERILGIGWDFSDATEGVGPSGWDSSQAAANQEVFMAFIDVLANATSEAFTGVHTVASDRDMFVRVRDGGGTPIKTFEASSATVQFLATAVTIAAVRTPDA